MADSQIRIPAKPVDPTTFFTVQEPPTKELQPDCYVVVRVNLANAEVSVLTYCWSVLEAAQLLESYALNEMAILAARDSSFPQVDSEAARERHRPSLQNPHGAGVSGLSYYKLPWEDVAPGDYIVFFEPEPVRIVEERTDDERIYLARRPHPKDDNYDQLSESQKQTGVNLIYYSRFTARMNIYDLLRAKTSLSEFAINNESVLVDADEYSSDEDDDNNSSSTSSQ